MNYSYLPFEFIWYTVVHYKLFKNVLKEESWFGPVPMSKDEEQSSASHGSRPVIAEAEQKLSLQAGLQDQNFSQIIQSSRAGCG